MYYCDYSIEEMFTNFINCFKIQVDVVLPLKTRRPAAITELITHA